MGETRDKRVKTVEVDAGESASHAVDPRTPTCKSASHPFDPPGRESAARRTGGGCLENLWVLWVRPDPLVYPTLVVFLEPDLPWATALGRSCHVTITPC